jgi:hypothetical protein
MKKRKIVSSLRMKWKVGIAQCLIRETRLLLLAADDAAIRSGSLGPGPFASVRRGDRYLCPAETVPRATGFAASLVGPDQEDRREPEERQIAVETRPDSLKSNRSKSVEHRKSSFETFSFPN